MDTVRDHVWHQGSGDGVYLGDEEYDTENYRGTFLPIRAGLFAATTTRPNASGLGATVYAPDGEVTRYQLSGGKLFAPKPVEHDGRRLEVVTADPQTNTVAFRSVGAGSGNRSCSYAVDADDLIRSWQTCDYRITAISPDGRYVFGHSGAAGGRSAVFNADGDVVLALDAVFGPVVLDDRNRLNLIGVGGFNDVGPQIAMVVCGLDGTCRRASGIHRYPLEQGTVPLALVGFSRG